jgi:triosephosphate isomerase
MGNVIIAYEPVWAIGTGKTATAEQADEVCGFIRGVIAKKYGKAVANKTIIQYGGSMNAKNAAELLAMPNIDGGLIGGASLKAPDFTVIVDAAQ